MDKDRLFIEKILAEKVDTTNTDHDVLSFLEKLSELSASKKDLDIAINDAKANYISNLLALKALLGIAEKEIRIYTSHVRDDIYGNSLIRTTFSNWLQGDINRKAYFLVREDFSLEQTRFFPIIEQFRPQVEIRRIKLKKAEECTKSAVIIDSQAIKIKKCDNGIEYVVVNFGAQDIAAKLGDLFDAHFFNDNNSCPLNNCETGEFDLLKDYIGNMVTNIIDSENQNRLLFKVG